jgi:hypothetical protein
MGEKRPPLKLCPTCRIAMQASKSSEQAGYDTFHCGYCGLAIVMKPFEPKRGPGDKK